MNGRLEVLFQSGLQFDGMMEGKWLVPDPCAVGGRLTVSGPSWRAEDRQEWGKRFEVAAHALDSTRWLKLSKRKALQRSSTVTDPSLDSSSSSCSQTADAADYRASSLLFLAKGRKDEMTWGGWKWRGTAGSYFKGSIRGEGKATFWQLELQWRKKRVG